MSARRPVKLLLLRRTSASTSFDILSSWPGFGRPKAFLFSCNDEKRSVARWTMALEAMKSNDELDFSAMMDREATRKKGEDEESERAGGGNASAKTGSLQEGGGQCGKGNEDAKDVGWMLKLGLKDCFEAMEFS